MNEKWNYKKINNKSDIAPKTSQEGPYMFEKNKAEEIKTQIWSISDFDDFIKDKKENALFVDYFPDHEDIQHYEKNNIITDHIPGEESADKTYIIGDITSKDSYTTGLSDCHSLIVSAVDKKEGKNISFLTHHAPETTFHQDTQENFLQSLNIQLQKVKDKALEGSIKASIAGGLALSKEDDPDEWSLQHYNDMLSLVSDNIKQELDTNVVVKSAPVTPSINDDAEQHVFFDNSEKIIHVFK